MSKELANTIRQEIKKKLGLNRNQVSVTNEYCGYSSAVTVHVKDENVNKDDYLMTKIYLICNRFEHVDRDENGEILQGGNTYIAMYDKDMCSYIPPFPTYSDMYKTLFKETFGVDYISR